MMEPGSEWRRVLVVDDGSILLMALGAALDRRGYEVHSVPDEENATALPAAIATYRPDVVLLNQRCLVARGRQRLQRWLRSSTTKFLALRQGDQPTSPAELRHSLARPVTICTPADLQTLLPERRQTRFH